ncbi:MAG: formate dehydrogenase, partial [Candidatus Phosphoribacter sp.]
MGPVTRVWVPRDAAAVSVGADEVAAAFTAAPGVDVVRTGSRGMLWLEPLVEIDTPGGRIGVGRVRPEDVPTMLQELSGPPAGRAGDEAVTHAGVDEVPEPAAYVRLGVLADHPWLTRQSRVTTARLGIVDPASEGDYAAHDGWRGLERACAMSPAEVVEQVVASGLRGRGGAGFPTGIKWRTVAATDADVRFIVANADEGDSGTFADRMVMEGDPFALIEGMLIAGYAVGAAEGFVYVRSEYPHAVAALHRAVDATTAAGRLGPAAFGRGRPFHLEVRVGAGAYICGEETSL